MDLRFTEQIRSRLRATLPGEVSHRRMRPLLENGERIRFSNTQKPRDGAVLILFYESAGQLRFPLIQRPTYIGPHSGQISLPGGKWEESDGDLYETALREAEEEIGVVAGKVSVLGSLTSFNVAASNYQVLPVIGYYPEIPKYYPDKVEVDEVIDVALHDLIDDSNMKRKTIEVGNQVKLDSPYFDLGSKVVWGATAGMLAELRDIILEIDYKIQL